MTQNSGDLGPVYWEYFPENLSATSVPGGLQVSGEFHARAGAGAGNQDYLIELFRNDACDPSGYGEGQNVLAQLPVSTNSAGLASFSTTVPGTTTGAITATATALDPGSGRATSEFSACLVVGGGAGGVTLDAVQTSVPSTGAVPSRTSRVVVRRRHGGAAQSAPITNIPIKNIPIKNIPIKNIPITNIGFSDPSILPLLSVFPLSSVPLLRTGGWQAALAGSAFSTTPLQNVSLGDVLRLPSIAALQLTLDDLDLSRTPLGELPAVATVLGTVPLSSLPLPGGADWCSFVGPGVQCSGSSSVLSIAIQGAPITNIPITNIPITNIPITNIPITNIPITNIPITNIPIKNIPITNIPITNIAGFAGLIDCGSHPCAGSTVYDALVGGWFLRPRPRATSCSRCPSRTT